MLGGQGKWNIFEVLCILHHLFKKTVFGFKADSPKIHQRSKAPDMMGVVFQVVMFWL